MVRFAQGLPANLCWERINCSALHSSQSAGTAASAHRCKALTKAHAHEYWVKPRSRLPCIPSLVEGIMDTDRKTMPTRLVWSIFFPVWLEKCVIPFYPHHLMMKALNHAFWLAALALYGSV